MPQTVGRAGATFAVETKLLFVEDRLKKLALPPGKK
jgi:hypothetical protein